MLCQSPALVKDTVQERLISSVPVERDHVIAFSAEIEGGFLPNSNSGTLPGIMMPVRTIVRLQLLASIITAQIPK